MGRADVLFKFLQLMGKNHPKDVDGYLKQLDPENDRPVVDQLVDLVIAGNEQGYAKYNQARSEIMQTDQHVEKSLVKASSPRFLEKWIKFEDKVRAIALLKRISHQGALSQSLLSKLQIFSDADLGRVESLQRLRNQIVHGTDAPPSNILVANPVPVRSV